MVGGMTDVAFRALSAVVGLASGETIVVIRDDETDHVASAFVGAAVEMGATVREIHLSADRRPMRGVPEEWTSILDGAQVVLNLFSAIPEETPFRVALLQQLRSQQCRVAHAPGISPEMLVGGALDVDYSEMKASAGRMLSALRDASYVRLESTGGTDVTLYIERRPFSSDVGIKEGQMGNLPCGEVWCAPVEILAEGTLVVDGSIGNLGAVPAPVVIKLDGGRIRSLSCSDDAFQKKVEELVALDDEAQVLGEFGIGINPKARVTGNILEDGKAKGVVRLAFGNNQEMPSGGNRSQTHLDLIIKNAEIIVHYVDGHGARLVDIDLVNV